MATLGETASLIRSKNAGPFFLTFDIMFGDAASYQRACRSRALTRDSIARLYEVPEASVEVFHYAPAHAIKITMPRKTPSCDLGDSDGHGGQQFAPLVDLTLDCRRDRRRMEGALA
jgi:hypothetical protein